MLNTPPPPLPNDTPPGTRPSKSKPKKAVGAAASSAVPKRVNTNAPIRVKNESAKPSPSPIVVRSIGSASSSATNNHHVSPTPLAPSAATPASTITTETPTPPGRVRLLKMLAMNDPLTRDDICTKMKQDETDVVELLGLLAEPVPALKRGVAATGSTRYRLRARSWRLVRPYVWKGLTTQQMHQMAEKACGILETLGVPENDSCWEHVRPRTIHDAPSGKHQPPKHATTASKPSASSSSKTPSTQSVKQQAQAKRSEAQASVSTVRPVKTGVKREREPGEVEEDFEIAADAPLVSRRPSSVASKSSQRESMGDNSAQAHARVKQAPTALKEEPLPKRKIKETAGSDRERRRAAREEDGDRDRERRREEKRRKLDDEGLYKQREKERVRETQTARDRERESDARRVRRERSRSASPLPRKKRERSASPPVRYERSISPLPVKRKVKREASPPPAKPKVRHEASPALLSAKPFKPRHQRESSAASSRSKPLPNYTSSEDESASERSRSAVVPTSTRRQSHRRPPSDPIPTARPEIERRYKRGYNTYILLRTELEGQRQLNQMALDGDDEAGESILSENELMERVKIYNEWHNELIGLRRAFEKLDGMHT
ncbi:hypothetical protein K488DRAFT_89390 [Vararia minispora EC-137]|uniref:Uncharacterized protein n=1 Tax=Vararia minispora EC-137 TaxID=1314806 RepID=A0ACB8QAG6_9AGAM|nr:hypothetical protein K488DRAFT_89390 [Vararia minispora EC-137]